MNKPILARDSCGALRRAAATLIACSAVNGVIVTAAHAEVAARPAAGAEATSTIPVAGPGTIRITQANLLSGQPIRKFQADVATVLASDPDFITYNEVPDRQDAVLAPAPYQLWRTPGQYTGETPVAWNAAKWTMVNEGTTMVSNTPGKEPGETVDWGIRYANWVTLHGVDGQTISVISTHVAPINTITEGLVPPSIDNLGTLATALSASGPVLMAGDFNFSYTSAAYPRDLLTQWGFTPTYDVLGSYLPTGDHYGNTIDYVFLHSASQFVVQGQWVTEINSDHNALTADVALTGAPVDVPVTFAPGTLTNSPTGGKAGRRGVLDLMVRAVQSAPPGAAVHLSTTSLGDKTLTKALLTAYRHGVHVQVATLDARPVGTERRLMNGLRARVHRKSWGVQCTGGCTQVFARHHLPQTRLLVSQAGATSALRIDSDQPLTWIGAKQLTTATITTAMTSYDKAFESFFRLVGLKV